MPTGPSFGAADVFLQARSFLNDFTLLGEVFTDAKIVVYMQAAWEQLTLKLDAAGAPTFLKQTVLTIPTTLQALTFLSAPPLPADFMEPIFLEESPTGKSDWAPMHPLKMGHTLNTAIADRTEALRVWAWKNGSIQFVGATTIRDVLVHYFASEPELTAISTNIGRMIANARGYLSRKTAGYASLFIMQDLERAAALNDEAMDFLDTILGMATKQAQNTPVRRRGFGSSRRRGMWYPKTSN